MALQKQNHLIDPSMLEALPHATGIYIFRGDGPLPLYIGKSTDIRSRVLTHLRDRYKRKMIKQSRRVNYVETSGDIGAQLLEALFIKQYNPFYNIRLRKIRKLYSIRILKKPTGLVTDIIGGKDVVIGQTENLYGIFRSQRAASDRLRDLASLNHLCHGTIGLESLNGRGCFGLQVRSCRGVCIGKEDRQIHDQRLIEALDEMKVHVWPYPAAIDLIEESNGWIQRHRIDQWRYLGTWCSRRQSFIPCDQQIFDLDIYKILVKPIITGQAYIEPALDMSSLSPSIQSERQTSSLELRASKA